MTDVLYLIRSLNIGGSERQLITLVSCLHARGHNVSVVTFYAEGSLLDELRTAGVPIHNLGKRGRWDLFPVIIRFIRLLRSERPRILHGYLDPPNIVAVAAKLLFPPLRVVWGVRGSANDFQHHDWLARLCFRASCSLARFADLIIINSECGLQHHAAHGYPSDRMVVIPNGIDTEMFSPDPEGRTQIRSEWGVRPSDRLVGYVARLDPIKDHATFLEAASLLASSVDRIRFVCVGDGPKAYRDELRALAAHSGLDDLLIWAGFRSDMRSVYNALDIGVSSSLSEGFPNCIGEAMACGVPCVVTDVGDSAVIVGDRDAVVPRSNPVALAQAVRLSLERMNSYDATALRTKIVEKFSLERLIQSTEERLGLRCPKGPM